jgi:hypothetical protein
MSDFRDIQNRLTAWLRQPDRMEPPADVELRRLHIYRELFFNNVSGFIENGFPVLRAMVPEAYWRQLLGAFFAEHRCQSPYFHDIPAEFLQWIGTRPDPAYPWLQELVHFEWAGLAAEIAEGELPEAVAGDVWRKTPQLLPWVWPLLYQWPVHRFPPAAIEVDPAPYALLMYRTPEHEVHTLEVSVPVAAVIDSLQAFPAPLTETVNTLARAQGLDAVRLRAELLPWISPLRERGILLGVIPDSR